jgi:cell division septum initiation protein DivIVA
MTDIERAKYMRIMAEIEDLEEKVDDLERLVSGGEHARRQDLSELRDRLAERMRELARITDGCARPGASGS